MVLGIGRWSHIGITGTTRQYTLVVRLHLVVVIIIKVIPILVRLLAEARVSVDLIWVKDRRLLGPI